MLKTIKYTGLVVFITGLLTFTFSSFFGEFRLDKKTIESEISQLVDNGKMKPAIGVELKSRFDKADIYSTTFTNPISFTSKASSIITKLNNEIIAKQDWDNKISASASDFAFSLANQSSNNIFNHSPWLMFFLTFGLAIIGGLMFIIPDAEILGPAGIKNDGVFHGAATNRGWIGYIVFGYLVTFYLLLYYNHHFLVNQIALVTPISEALSGNAASHWFLYGFIYCSVMSVMGVRMFIKYRHNQYQMVRTAVVLFFQIVFAFLIPEILVRFNMPYMDLKNAWPLDYDFFYTDSIDKLIADGTVGIAMLVWGILLTVVVVPVMVYFYGKRWYCSWVCGCGGLAETLGDPYRQLSSKKVSAWKLERWLIHGVLAFAIIMTVITIGAYFNDGKTFLGIQTYSITSLYGLLVGSIFSGVIGTGFYPVLGNRTWCRFGCPLAAYMGIVQRFKSRFRITTNGGQCISCGNCSTYCEQGIDVRWYAQRGQNIVRSSCVGCGVCSAVCPRGVLNLENGPEEGRINDLPIIIGENTIGLKS